MRSSLTSDASKALTLIGVVKHGKKNCCVYAAEIFQYERKILARYTVNKNL